MTLSSGASLKKVKAQAGRKKKEVSSPLPALRRRLKTTKSPQQGQDHQLPILSSHQQAHPHTDTSSSPQATSPVSSDSIAGIQTIENTHEGGDGVQQTLRRNSPPVTGQSLDDTSLFQLRRRDSLSHQRPDATNTFATLCPETTSPYRQRLDELRHRRADSERLQRAIANNQHMQLVVFCHQKNSSPLRPEDSKLSEMLTEEGNDLATPLAASSSTETAAVSKARGESQAALGSSVALPDNVGSTSSKNDTQPSPSTNGGDLANWNDEEFTYPALLGNHPCNLSPTHPQASDRKRRKKRIIQGSKLAPSNTSGTQSRPPSSASITELSVASEMEVGHMLLLSQISSVRESTRLDSQAIQAPTALRAASVEQEVTKQDQESMPPQRTHQVRSIRIKPWFMSESRSTQSPSRGVDNPPTTVPPQSSTAPFHRLASHPQPLVSPTPSQGSIAQKERGKISKKKSDVLPNDRTSLSLETRFVGRAHVPSNPKEHSHVDGPSNNTTPCSDPSNVTNGPKQIRGRLIPGAPASLAASNTENKSAGPSSRPQKDKRSARDRKQQELHRRRIAEAVAAAERGEKVQLPPLESRRDSYAIRKKASQSFGHSCTQEGKSSGSNTAAEVPEGFSPRSRESAVSKTETEDSYHTAASVISTSSPRPESRGSSIVNSGQREEARLRDQNDPLVHPNSEGLNPFPELTNGNCPHTITKESLSSPETYLPNWRPLDQECLHTLNRRPHLRDSLMIDRSFSSGTSVVTDPSEAPGSQSIPTPLSDSPVDFDSDSLGSLTLRWSPDHGKPEDELATVTASTTSSKGSTPQKGRTPSDADTRISFSQVHPPGQFNSDLSCKYDGHLPEESQAKPEERMSRPDSPPLGPELCRGDDLSSVDRSKDAVLPPPKMSSESGKGNCTTGSVEQTRIAKPSDSMHVAAALSTIFPAQKWTQQGHLSHHAGIRNTTIPATSSFRNPQNLLSFKRQVNELNAFEDIHQRRSRAREERLARLHCFDLEGFVETRRTITETDGPSKGCQKIVRLWRTHSMLAPGRRLGTTRHQFDSTGVIAPVREQQATGKGGLIHLHRSADQTKTGSTHTGSVSASQRTFVTSSSLPYNLSRFAAAHKNLIPSSEKPSTITYSGDLSAGDLSHEPSMDVSGTFGKSSVTEGTYSLDITSTMPDPVAVGLGPAFADAGEGNTFSSVVASRHNPDVCWLDTLQSLATPEREALKQFLQSQDDNLDLDWTPRGDQAGREFSSLSSLFRHFPPVHVPPVGTIQTQNYEPVAAVSQSAQNPQNLRRSVSVLSAGSNWPTSARMESETASARQKSLYCRPPCPPQSREASSSPHPLSTLALPPGHFSHEADQASRSTSQYDGHFTLKPESDWQGAGPSLNSYCSAMDERTIAPDSCLSASAPQQTVPELQMLALLAAVQRHLSATGCGEEGAISHPQPDKSLVEIPENVPHPQGMRENEDERNMSENHFRTLSDQLKFSGIISCGNGELQDQITKSLPLFPRGQAHELSAISEAHEQEVLPGFPGATQRSPDLSARPQHRERQHFLEQGGHLLERERRLHRARTSSRAKIQEHSHSSSAVDLDHLALPGTQVDQNECDTSAPCQYSQPVPRQLRNGPGHRSNGSSQESVQALARLASDLPHGPHVSVSSPGRIAPGLVGTIVTGDSGIYSSPYGRRGVGVTSDLQSDNREAVLTGATLLYAQTSQINSVKVKPQRERHLLPTSESSASVVENLKPNSPQRTQTSCPLKAAHPVPSGVARGSQPISISCPSRGELDGSHLKARMRTAALGTNLGLGLDPKSAPARRQRSPQPPAASRDVSAWSGPSHQQRQHRSRKCTHQPHPLHLPLPDDPGLGIHESRSPALPPTAVHAAQDWQPHFYNPAPPSFYLQTPQHQIHPQQRHVLPIHLSDRSLREGCQSRGMDFSQRVPQQLAFTPDEVHQQGSDGASLTPASSRKGHAPATFRAAARPRHEVPNKCSEESTGHQQSQSQEHRRDAVCIEATSGGDDRLKRRNQRSPHQHQRNYHQQQHRHQEGMNSRSVGGLTGPKNNGAPTLPAGREAEDLEPGAGVASNCSTTSAVVQ